MVESQIKSGRFVVNYGIFIWLKAYATEMGDVRASAMIASNKNGLLIINERASRSCFRAPFSYL